MKQKTLRTAGTGMMIAVLSMMLLACGNQSTNGSSEEATTASTSNEAQATTAEQENAASSDSTSETKLFKDWTGHEVEVPTNPQRVIYHGEVTGDLLALGIVPVGILKQEGTVFDDQVAEAEDVGFPISTEKSLALNPDLIIISNSDETLYEQVSKVAPTVTFNSFDPLEERIRFLGDLFDKKQEAEDWLAAHAAATEEMWKLLRENGLQEGETASVFTMYPGDRLFAMAGAGLPQLLYGEGGMKPTAEIQKVLDEELGFVEISQEKMPEFAGDRIFILNAVTPEAQKSTEDMMQSNVWKSLPAVKAGKVYSLDIVKASSDATSREWLLQELPKLMIP
ncbi:iron complex transport system substrate-binding protein [Paenibacillus phyllosphaerae]|uniref:Iron complex transport system substrate-binding protein n=1 Tax=Paenibacillus phyllosphaerae TaxID=274593 RepID=A0A7W5FPJ8_9BACL|nr:ABC transporter substrate-binding protein [Paenibacillus phyllosphaerae]MBB3112109.1 iron complex transport system substrate-binding protein [Paenibacillus phyllosphaerae]